MEFKAEDRYQAYKWINGIFKVIKYVKYKINIKVVIPKACITIYPSLAWIKTKIKGPTVRPDINVNKNRNMGANVGLFLTPLIANININSIIIRIKNKPDGMYWEKYAPIVAINNDPVKILNTFDKNKFACILFIIN